MLGTLARHKLLNVGLSLIEELLSAIDLLCQGGNQVASLQGHVKLKMGHVLAEVFPIAQIVLNRRVCKWIEARIQNVLSQAA